MNELGQQLAAELELEALAQKVVDATTRLAGAHAGAFAFRAADGGLHRAVASGPHAELARRLPIAPTLDQHRPIRVADLQDAAASVMPPAELAISSYLAVPVTGRSGRMIGALV